LSQERPGTRLLEGIRVVDLAGEPAAMTGRLLADLGAEVILVEPPTGHALRDQPDRWAAWGAGKQSLVVADADDPALGELLDAADIVIDTPGFPEAWTLDPATAPTAVWVSVTPFGLTGPRSGWRASDLGVMASSGNMFCTGDPDREPVRCTEPSGYAHGAAEAAFAALTGLASGRPQRIDLSLQEVVFIANMATASRFPQTGFRGQRRGASIGRTREIWPTLDGFVSYGLRGGKARVPSLETLTRLVDTPAMHAMDWATFSPNTADDETLQAIEVDVAAYFAQHTMSELYDIACETNLMLAPINSPKEILASAQLAARDFFGPLGEFEKFPSAFVTIESSDGEAARSRPSAPAPDLGANSLTTRPPKPVTAGSGGSTEGAWAGTKILEFGSGAAGPIATRYFAEHGATVLRVESKGRPDFLRVYALGPKNPHGLEGAPMFDGLNVGKQDVTFNLKQPQAVELVKRLIFEWADAVAENFAPRAMRGFGLDYATLAAEKPDLVMVSACLNGQTGPHRDYPGFGGQGSALAGYNFLTGWPDREPVGPHGTITDSLAPRFVATALAAGLLYRRRTGRGLHLDVSQVEAAIFSLSPWLLEYQLNGRARSRIGNSSERAPFHEVLACADETAEDGSTIGDRWVAVAAWTEEEFSQLLDLTGGDPSAYARGRTRLQVADTLQAAGIEAVPVEDFGDVHSDPQVAHREHFVPLTHPFLGDGLYERNGFRLSDGPSTYLRAGPLLGQDQDWVLTELLGLDPAEQASLAADGVFD
jgi:crotonobetainyl-CoA:carnitine CoA-transferase CaiB-like acyl-CoA transferase